MSAIFKNIKCGEADVSYYGLDDRFTIEQFKHTSIEKLIFSVLEKYGIISSELGVYENIDSVPEKSDGISSKFYPNESDFTVFCENIDTYENGIVIYLKYPKRLQSISGHDCTYSSAALIIGPEETSFIITDFGIRNLPAYWKDKKIYDVFGVELDDHSKMELRKTLEINKNAMDQMINKMGKKYDTGIFYERLEYYDYPNPDATEKSWIEYSMLDKLIHKMKESKQLKYILNARINALSNLTKKVLGEELDQEIENTRDGRAR